MPTALKHFRKAALFIAAVSAAFTLTVLAQGDNHVTHARAGSVPVDCSPGADGWCFPS